MPNQENFMGRITNNWQQRASEKTTFRDDLRVIPRGLIRLLGAAYVVALAVISVLVFVPRAIPDPMVGEPLALRMLWMYGIVTAGAAVVSAYLLLLGYIAGDAKRRGMRPVLWVLLAILVPYLIGVILYFVVREPLPFKCPQCGAAVMAQFNFCPSCKFNLRPNCPQCRRAISAGDRFCPHCGFGLPSDAPAPAGAQAV
jgi:double zinc ribbon protein